MTDGCDSRFVGGVITSAGTGRACYNGTATGSSAVYACNCPSLYKLEGTATRICQSDGTWTGAMPQCLPECRFYCTIACTRTQCMHLVTTYVLLVTISGRPTMTNFAYSLLMTSLPALPLWWGGGGGGGGGGGRES